ncbi:MAG: DUF3817 domain-containing protein [Gammaproteobacteria bacterium]|nr:DUF3817 domain-containing protein [Gammaproteobacteria bacterium]MDH5727604.1 DUF3817 domain-containing protein [Gammaproteobacteria bacterium]
MNQVNMLRSLALIEAVSLLVLLFIAMPMKYQWGMPQAVSMVGMVHGILFLLFVFFANYVTQRQAWSEKFLMLMVVCSMVPFATFFIDQRLKQYVPS